MRHHLLSHPQDKQSLEVIDQYMFGKSILVAPVVTEGTNERELYLPEEEKGWIDVASHMIYDESDGRHRIKASGS